MSVLLRLTRIIQSASEADSPAMQVNCIVNGIHQALSVDVCSLFLRNDRDELLLVASQGLGAAAVGRATLPVGKGLVGQVAITRMPANIVDPETHPAFHYLPGSGEEQFRSFSAVPLIRAGALIGVLAVQRRAPEVLGEEDEAFLVTLAAQLALVVANWSDWHQADSDAPHSYSGVRGAPGIALGQALLCEDLDLFSVPDGENEDSELELANWRGLIEQVQDQVGAEQAALDGDLSSEVGAIFDAYLMLLADPTLGKGVEDGIRAGMDLPSALRTVIQHYADLFIGMDDPYLRARHEDIRHLGNRLYAAWRKTDGNDHFRQIDGQVVLVGHHLGVSDIARVPRDKLVGVISMQGSSLSHTAVLANALGIPAVLGIGEIKGIKEGDPLIVDGNAARVLLKPDATLWAEYSKLLQAEAAFSDQLADLRDMPAITRDGVAIGLFANSGLTADVQPGLGNGAEGLGLFRTEIPFMASDAFPSEEEQYQWYQEVMQAYRGKQVYMRVLDIGADKPLPYFPITEENPALGWRGIRFCLDNSPLLVTQLRAMLRASIGTENLKLMLPMVSGITELREFHALLDDTITQLDAEEIVVPRPQVGIMVEVPAAISQLTKWRQYIDFISIGSNDLSQYLTAVDRNNPRVASRYDHLHPAVLAEIARILEAAEKLGLPVSVCGEMSSDPAAVVLLIGMGVRRLSMSAAQLPRIKWIVRSLDSREAQALFLQASEASEAVEIRNLLTSYLSRLESAGKIH